MKVRSRKIHRNDINFLPIEIMSKKVPGNDVDS